MSHTLATVALGPLLLVQGRWARARAPQLPEPPGPRRGVAGAGGVPLRILVVGDSSGAGVGADHQEEALLGRIVSSLSRTRRVEWRLEARTGATTEGTLAHLRRAEPGEFDVAVTALGVNDVIAGARREDWLVGQRRLRELLRTRFGVRLTVVSGFPPVHAFPALPQPLRWYLGRRCRDLDAEHRVIVEAEPGARFLPLDFIDDVAAMASDGFHPGPEVYRAWGHAVAQLVEVGLETAH